MSELSTKMVCVEEIQEEFADLDIEVTEDDVLLKLKVCSKSLKIVGRLY